MRNKWFYEDDIKLIELYNNKKTNKEISLIMNRTVKSIENRIIKLNLKEKYGKRLSNTYDLTGEYGIGHTSNGKIFYFDLEDYDKIKDYCWHFDKKGHICSSINKNSIRQHRIIMNCLSNKDIQIDHIYHNNNDNRKKFLRFVTNQRNQGIDKTNSSGKVGVCYSQKRKNGEHI